MLKFTKAYSYLSAAVVVCSSLLTKNLSAQVTVTSGRTALQLAQAITGNGVTVTNATLNCAQTGNGIFTSPNNTVGIDEGIVLATGNANQVGNSEPGVNSTSFNRTGDADLTAISGTNVTRDACVLEFDVTPVGDELKFEYVFASEEYVNAVCGPFNDVFAFFISGPGIAGTRNIALVPNTNIPVAVNSVNNGIVGTHPGSTIANCTGMGAGAPFTQYYINNTGNSFFAYRGYTTVFTAKQNVTPCQTYHLKLAVADAGNYLYDSGVLIKAGSLSSTSINATVTAPLNLQNVPTAIKGCNNGQISIQRSQAKPIAQTVQLIYGGNAQSALDYAALPTSVIIPANAVSASIMVNGLPTTNRGDRTLTVYVVDPFNCNNTIAYVDTVHLQLIEQPSVTLLTDDDSVCSGVAVPTQVTTSRDLFTFNWSPSNSLSNPTVPNPILYPNTTTTYFVNAGIPNSGCADVRDSLLITVIAGPQNIAFSEDEISICKGGQVNVTATVTPVINGLDYAWVGPNSFAHNGNTLNINDAQTTQTGWYKLSVTAEGCNTIVDSVYVKVGGTAKNPIIPSIQVCQYEQVAFKDADKYSWYLNAFGGVAFNRVPELNTTALGTHTLYAAQEVDGCWSERVPVVVEVIKCCNKDMFVANAFSPNNDGINDVFEIKFDPGTNLTAFQVYNRWGQRVYTNAGSDVKWDGTMNNQNVDNGVYFYFFQAQCLDGTKIERRGELHVIR